MEQIRLPAHQLHCSANREASKKEYYHENKKTAELGSQAPRKEAKVAYYKQHPRRSKYGAKKINIDGEIFDSKREAKRWQELKLREDLGLISDLRRQVKYVLVPAQREPDTVGARGGIHRGKLIEREVSYYADFVYTDSKTGELVVEDVKGYKGGGAYELFKIKRKMMLWLHGIRVKEV